MTLPEACPDPFASAISGRLARWILVLATAASFLLVLQNYALDILPDRRIEISAGQVRPYSADKTFAYVFDFNGSEPDAWPTMRSRVKFFEGSHSYSLRLHKPDETLLVGGERFGHEKGRIVFSSTDNTDPRTNGRKYSLTTPVLYKPAIGVTAMAVFLGCVLGWYAVCRQASGPRTIGPVSHWRWHLWGATALFALGLYCNTGTLAPYANTNFPLVFPDTGYAYNGDHIHFRVLFDFVDGKDRSVWDHAILLRRILFPVLGWPLMKALGFELGGTITSLILNIAALVAALVLLRRWIGERGAIFAGWLMALYPGAAYWAGLPYTYALIFPASLLLMLGLMRLAGTRGFGTLCAVSLGMGVAYLGYDLAITFVPATLIVLCWRRRFFGAAAAVVIQMAPTAAWMYALARVFHQPLQNGNSGIYVSVLSAFFHRAGGVWWWQQVLEAPGYGFDIFFASNFIFIPALFLVVLVLNPLTSRIRFDLAETALLVSGLALFLILNLAPSDTGGWEMRGNWIARLYQPVFPALVLYISRWWQDLPPLTQGLRLLVLSAVAAATLGDALVVFGPILNDPAHVSETAFYRFYDHTDAHFVYENNLRNLGRRPIGFTRKFKAPTLDEMVAQQAGQLAAARGALDGIRKAISDNRAALIQVQSAYRDVARGVAEARSALYSRRLDRRLAKGEITADEAKRQTKTIDDFVGPSLRVLMKDPSLDPKAPLPKADPAPEVMGDVQRAITADSVKLTNIETSIGVTQNQLKEALSDLSRTQDELARFEKGDEAAPHP